MPASDIFQHRMIVLFQDLAKMVKVYIDDLLGTTKGSFTDHMRLIDEVLTRLEEMGMQVNPTKSYWERTEVKYFGFIIVLIGSTRSHARSKQF